MPRTGMSAQEIKTKAIDCTLSRMRQHGFEKVRLSDVAKDMDVSHAALYAHFADKAALLDAVTERWINESDANLEEICRQKKEPLQKIHDWFLTCYRTKRQRALLDPQLFLSFDAAAALKKPCAITHLATLHRQLTGLLDEAGEQIGGNPEDQARLLFAAMSAFHHPKLVAESRDENREELLNFVLDTMLAGMGARR